MKDTYSRREFLIALFAISGISFCGGSYLYSLRVEEALQKLSTPINEESIKNVFSSVTESMNIIGKEYVNKKLPNVSKAELSASLNKKLSSRDITREELFSVKERISKEVKRDFNNNNIVFIDNWMITQTEAQLCAIFYLSE